MSWVPTMQLPQPESPLGSLTMIRTPPVLFSTSRRGRRSMGERDQTGTATFWLSIISFMVLNAAIGYAVASPGDRAVEPLWMFAVAMGLHFLANDHSLVEHHGDRYQHIGRWLPSA